MAKKAVLKEGMFVTPPNKGKYGELTPGKKYKVSCVENFDQTMKSFYITNDSGQYIFCIEKYCSHIQHQNWAIVPNN